jgi:hypothetical protein
MFFMKDTPEADLHAVLLVPQDRGRDRSQEDGPHRVRDADAPHTRRESDEKD